MSFLTRTIWILSMVSLFADVASEMLYPIIPVYLREIGFSVALIGLLEGIAEFVVGLSKGYFATQSDQRGLRLPYIKSGYLLSALSKPMMAVFTFPVWIFLARMLDRTGKGLRTGARDALLSQEATPATKARVFSFHRGWDTFGAVMGPLFALLYLSRFPHQYQTLFYIAFIPGLISVALIFLLKETKRPVSTIANRGFFSFFSYWKIAPADYRKLVIPLLLFALANSSDLFLILKTKEITGDDSHTIASYIFYNLVYALSSFPMGILADRIGLKKVFLSGMIIFISVYTGFAFARETWHIYGLFALYGIYAAATEGIAKAWITNIARHSNTATAIGFYTSCQSIAALLASILAGLLWQLAGSRMAFLFTAALTFFVVIFIGRSQFQKQYT